MIRSNETEMSTRKGEIVVVDDDAESLKLLTDILSQEGYHVRPAHTGKLALASIAAAPPELILLDKRMPGMDGFEVCRRLKEFQQTRDIPVIFLSGSDREEQHVEGFHLGAVDFVTKPFKHRELLARIQLNWSFVGCALNLKKEWWNELKTFAWRTSNFIANWPIENALNRLCGKVRSASEAWPTRPR